MMRGRSAVPIRYLVLFMLLFASCVSYGDRTVLGIAGPALAASLGLNAVEMGYLLSAASLPNHQKKQPNKKKQNRKNTHRNKNTRDKTDRQTENTLSRGLHGVGDVG